MALHWKILIAMITGVIWALISENLLILNSFNANWLAPFGDLLANIVFRASISKLVGNQTLKVISDSGDKPIVDDDATILRLAGECSTCLPSRHTCSVHSPVGSPKSRI